MRIIEIPDDGIIRTPIMQGQNEIGERCLDLSDLPTIDAVPVVRCKDCKNYRQNPYSGEDDVWCMCWSDWVPTEPDDFCSYGERKEGAE